MAGIALVSANTCIITFSSTGCGLWDLTCPGPPLAQIENAMATWLASKTNVVIIGSGLSRSDDESRNYYTGYFLYNC